MSGMRDIKRRIRSVKNTQQITKAMQMVASAKLRKAQDNVEEARPYAEKVREVTANLVRNMEKENFSHPLLDKRDEGSSVYTFITADRGLCGGYNANIVRLVESTLNQKEGPTGLIPIGRKGRDYFRWRGFSFIKEFIDIGDAPNFIQARDLIREITALYNDRENNIREVFLVYTEFFSAIRHEPVIMRLLPVSAPALEETENDEENKGSLYLYEPSQAGVLSALLPRYVETMMYLSLLEAKASEQGARMTAMQSATDSAQEMIESLTLSFNRARQSEITTEIMEVVSGAEALK